MDNLIDINIAFEKNVKKAPNAAALHFNDTFVTYDELNKRANQLAYYLRKLGVGPEVLIGVYSERTPDFIIFVLGILKAGGAFLPLDPAYPSERLEYIIKDSQIDMILSNTKLQLLNLQFDLPIKKITINDYLNEISDESSENLNLTINSNSLAYVLYTSGSTGKPKGVEIARNALNNFLCSMLKHPGMDRNDCILAITTFSFDMSIFETLLPLYAGASFVICDDDCAYNGKKMMDLIKKHEITIFQAVPACWFILIESGWKGNKNLKAVCGGEAMPRSLANNLVDLCGSVWNMYGPTETTVWSTFTKVSSGEDVVPIGEPIDNTIVYILDENLNILDNGEIGEIYIGGEGVARGYYKKPDLTKERFITLRCDNGNYTRLYKTGDLGKKLADGSFEYIGRADLQVKVRGYRIELNEIEAVMETLQAILQAVVVIQTLSHSDHRMVAYYRLSDDNTITTEQIKNELRKKLPEYMIPSLFISVSNIPLTLNGKVDRIALGGQPIEITYDEREIILPRTQMEKDISVLWKEMLLLDEISIYDNFFELGGHSLLAIKSIISLNQKFNITLSLIDVLTAGQSIADLAKIIECEIVKNADENDIQEILTLIEGMSDEERIKLQESIK
ncbi:MAG: non-ribosomal peptide synthetase [Lachnospiraceae bacterium]|nr:non-ribosomal peptide synthetase [Lachnospiraceae bacterium]